MKRLIGLVCVAAVVGGGWYGYHTVWAAPAGPQFRLDEVRRGTIVSTVSATGTIEPIEKVLVGSQVSGTVVKWYADFNQRVSKDFVLLELDQDRFRRALEQRKAAVLVAEATAEQARVRYQDAQRERRRIEKLFERGNASENELLVVQAAEAEAKAALQAAEAQIEVAVAERHAAEVDLDRTIIRSPIDGIVISRDVEAGQTVAASLQAPTLFTIAADLARMRVNANVSESDVGRVREGMKATFTVDAHPGRVFEGTVTQVRFNPTIVDTVVTYITLIDVANDDLALRPGMTATIALEVERATDVLTVANAALRFKPEETPDTRPSALASGPARGHRMTGTVYTLNGGTPVPVEVLLGPSNGTHSVVSGESLAEGTKVIVERLGGPSRPAAPRTFMRF